MAKATDVALRAMFHYRFVIFQSGREVFATGAEKAFSGLGNLA
jgi:hypothetical protein